MDTKREEELQTSEIPQLEARSQRSTDHVCDAKDRQNGTVHV